MTKQTINTIFPTCFTTGSTNREFTKNELDFFDSYQGETKRNYGNSRTINSYILDELEMQDLKNICLEHLKYYMEKIYKNSNLDVYITQSWLNYSNKNDYHHKHYHANSFLSGVMYINTNDNDVISLHTINKPSFQIVGTSYDVLNATNWILPVKNKDIIIFPSNIEHNVPTVNGDKTRISLAFNTFIKGTLGDSQILTELKL